VILLLYGTSVIVATGNVTDQLAKGACQYDSTLGVIKLRTDTDARRSDTDSALNFRCLHGVYRLRGTVLSCRRAGGFVRRAATSLGLVGVLSATFGTVFRDLR
jgi:hypothetical protein